MKSMKLFILLRTIEICFQHPTLFMSHTTHTPTHKYVDCDYPINSD